MSKIFQYLGENYKPIVARLSMNTKENKPLVKKNLKNSYRKRNISYRGASLRMVDITSVKTAKYNNII